MNHFVNPIDTKGSLDKSTCNRQSRMGLDKFNGNKQDAKVNKYNEDG